MQDYKRFKDYRRFVVSGDFADVEVLVVKEGKDFIFSFDAMGFEVYLYGYAERLEDGRYKVLFNCNGGIENAADCARFLVQDFLTDNDL